MAFPTPFVRRHLVSGVDFTSACELNKLIQFGGVYRTDRIKTTRYTVQSVQHLLKNRILLVLIKSGYLY